MSFLSLILALVLEQWRPLVDRTRIFAPLKAYSQIVERQFNAGEHQHGIISWLIIIVPIVALTWGLYVLALMVHPILGLVFNVLVLYISIGFRQESHFFTDIHKALKEGDTDRARSLLQQWQGHRADTLTPAEVVRLTIEGALATSHRHVFGAIFWFIVLPGPTGAVLYRATQFLYHRWSDRLPVGTAGGLYTPDTIMGDETDYLPTLAGRPSQAPTADGGPNRFGEFARVAFQWIDAIPARVTAASFAIVGDFEDAVYCWRTQAKRWPDPLVGIVLAAGAGALGVRLGMPIVRAGLIEDRPEVGVGEEADVAFLDSTVGLVWRALVLWLALLLVITVTSVIS
ncbi:MAG TPA: cobalamin biosynthesis protein [Burkholderiales bacterium]|nr:cobalamin biosynthesis protein [Burkholderiales bacterium]